MRAATRAALERMKAIPSEELLAVGAENADGDISMFLRVTADHAYAECGPFSRNLDYATKNRIVVLTAEATVTHNGILELDDRNDYLFAGSFSAFTDYPFFASTLPQPDKITACNMPYYQDVEMLAA